MFEKLNPFSTSPSSTPRTITEIVDLRIYPIKSCRGISIQRSYLTKKGLDLDRRWMFVDAETMKFITIREISEMTLIDTALSPSPTTSDSVSDSHSEESQNLIISIRNTSHSITIPARPSTTWLETNTTLSNVTIWGTQTDAYIYPSTLTGPFSTYLSHPILLVYKGREESTNFPDVLPVLVVNEGSGRELRERLRKKGFSDWETVGLERFRGNIVVRGSESDEGEDLAPKAWSEDSWKRIKISNSKSNQDSDTGIEIDIQARCARCQVPNVEPETGIKDKHEPWGTLVSYRRVDEGIRWKPCFGMLGVPRAEGWVEVGMRVEVVEETGGHRYVKGF